MTFPEDADENTKDLIDNLLRIDPKERIKFEDIKEHPFFEGINFSTLTSIRINFSGLSPLDDYKNSSFEFDSEILYQGLLIKVNKFYMK